MTRRSDTAPAICETSTSIPRSSRVTPSANTTPATDDDARNRTVRGEDEPADVVRQHPGFDARQVLARQAVSRRSRGDQQRRNAERRHERKELGGLCRDRAGAQHFAFAGRLEIAVIL